MPPIAWSAVRTAEVHDALGRAFCWRGLKGAKIFLCGHGAHIFRDGYCAVLPNTTVNSYQPYGQKMSNLKLFPFIAGDETALIRERSFVPGQSCQDMTLFDDDDNQLEDTNASLARRVRNEANCYVFNTNQFTGLAIYQEATPHPFNGKKILRLSQIMPVLEGNTLEWMCCQELMGWRKYVSADGTKVQTLTQQRGSAVVLEDERAAEKRRRFSEAVGLGLRTAETVASAVGVRGPRYEPGFQAQIGETRHTEGAGSAVNTMALLNKARIGVTVKPDPTNRAGLPSKKDVEAAKGNVGKDYLMWQGWLAKGLTALNMDPQPNTSMQERASAKVTLEQGLTRVGRLIESLNRL